MLSRQRLLGRERLLGRDRLVSRRWLLGRWWLWGPGQGSVGAEPRGQRAELVEDLDEFVVGPRLGQHLDGGGERLARPRGGTEPRLRIGLQQRGDDLPQRLGHTDGRPRRAVGGEVLDEGLGVGLGALQ
ncbi:hypothetical protein ABDJ25_22275 [Streptomyces actinocidus]